MSMALVLQAVAATLQTVNQWDSPHCDVNAGGDPNPTADEWCVAIDEGAVESLSEEFLHESYTVNVFVLRRAGLFPSDSQARAYYETNLYLQQQIALEFLERKVITALHRNYGVCATANTIGSLPSDEGGDQFVLPLVYKSRGGTEVYSPPSEGDDIHWLRRRLVFSGMNRLQDARVMQ